MYNQSTVYNKYYWMTLARAGLLVNISVCIYWYIEHSCMHHTYIKAMIISFNSAFLSWFFQYILLLLSEKRHKPHTSLASNTLVSPVSRPWFHSAKLTAMASFLQCLVKCGSWASINNTVNFQTSRRGTIHLYGWNI